jgi:hypothetical protein
VKEDHEKTPPISAEEGTLNINGRPNTPRVCYRPIDAGPADDIERRLANAFDIVFMSIARGRKPVDVKSPPS